jgi:O-antigen ligase
MVPFLAYFVGKRLTTNEQRLQKLIQVLGYTGAYLILMAVIQGALGKVERLSGPFGHRDSLYVVLVVVFFVVLTNLLTRRNRSEDSQVFSTGFSFFIVASIPIVVLLMWTRGDWIGFGFGLWVFFALSSQLLNFRRRLVFVALSAMLIPIVFVGAQEFATDFTMERVSNERNVYARLAAWQSIFNSVLDDPIFGNGLGNTEALLATQRSHFEGVKNLTSPHNSFLALLGDLGAIGLLAYLGLVASVFKMGLLLRRRGSRHRDRWRGVAVVSIMAAHLMAAFFNNMLFSPVISHVYVFAYLGAIAGLYNPVRARDHKYARSTESVAHQSVRTAPVVYKNSVSL